MKRFSVLLILVILMITGCASQEETPTQTPVPATPTSEPATAPEVPSALTDDPELVDFAESFMEIHMRLAQGIQLSLSASSEEWPATMVDLAKVNEDAHNLDIPDNEVAEALATSLQRCATHYHEDLTISEYLDSTALADCTQYIELYNQLTGE